MTKKQREKVIKTFKCELIYKGWKLDRWGNYVYADERVKITPLLWKHERKVDKKWINLEAKPLNALKEGDAPKIRPITTVELLAERPEYVDPTVKKVRKIRREINTSKGVRTIDEVVTAKEAAAVMAPLTVVVKLSDASEKRIDTVAFRQVQTNSRLDAMEKTFAEITKLVTGMAGMVESELHRIKSRPATDAEPLFYVKMFNKITHRLRKKSIDVSVEDIHNGAKRKRVFRCSDWTRVEHLMSYRTLTDGIEELEVKPPVRRKRKGMLTLGNLAGARKKPAKKVAKTPEQKIADARYEMEREGIKNSTVPMAKSKTAYMDKAADKAQQAENRTREKAEKVIVKLCSPGSTHEGAKDTELIDALVENGFTSHVAFYAAMNCGRITDPKVIKQHQPKRKAKVGETSNEY